MVTIPGHKIELEVPLASFVGMQFFQSKIVIECICGPPSLACSSSCTAGQGTRRRKTRRGGRKTRRPLPDMTCMFLVLQSKPGQPEEEDRRRADRIRACFVSIFCIPVVAEATGGIIMHVVHDGSPYMAPLCSTRSTCSL